MHNPNELVARFLLSNGYLDTLHAFSHEAGINLSSLESSPEDDGKEVITLESLLEERRLRELQIHLAQVRLAESEILPWRELALSSSTDFKLAGAASNVTFITVETVLDRVVLIVCTADKSVRLYDYHTQELWKTYTHHAAPVLECAIMSDHLVTGGMDSKVILTDLSEDSFQELVPHMKYVNRVVTHESFIITSSYDKAIHLYRLENDSAELIHSTTLATTPECLCIFNDELIVGARDTPFLVTYSIPALEEKTRYNMNENEDTWISFSAIDIKVLNHNTIIVSTSTVPLGRIILFSIEGGAIIGRRTIFTGATYSDYGVLPRLVKRVGGHGIWVNADDGLIRGIDLRAGKCKTSIASHEGGIRTLWTGIINDEEVVISGGFDKRVKVHKS